MARFLEQRCRTLECVDFSLAAYPPSNQVGRGRSSNNRSSCMIINARPALCALCGVLAHPLPTCPSFIALPLSQRYDEVRRLTRCFVCLEDGHFARGCSAARCPKCNRRHHALLHHCGQLPSSNNSPPLRSLGSAVGVAVATPPSQSINTVLTQDRPTEVLLPTANILIRGRSGAFLPCRVLLDSGSQVHLISSRLASQLQLRRTKSCVAVAGLGGTEFATDGSSVNVCVKSRLTTYCANLEAVIVSHIADCQPSLKIDISKWKIPHGVALADPNFHRPQGVDLLIGASLFFNLLSVGQIQLGPNHPILQKTLLGWIVSGKYLANSSTPPQPVSSLNCQEEILESIDKNLNKFWSLKEVPSSKKMLSPEQELCGEHYRKTTRILLSGRFEVKLPFKSDPSVLGNSFEIAKRRFLSLERRLSRDPNLKKMYLEFMEGYESLGHLSPASNDVLASPHYVIPHQCVLRPQSSTTKLRVVFDASCKTSTQKCLNELLIVGPTIQEELYSTLLRFRLNKFALVADIKKMYRQVMVNEADRRYQLILWRKELSESLKLCKLSTVTYGTAPAPFLAIRCLKRLSESAKNTFPRAA
ncbi:hypothetical protein KR067_009337, partial [Drosophila pandora]